MVRREIAQLKHANRAIFEQQLAEADNAITIMEQDRLGRISVLKSQTYMQR